MTQHNMANIKLSDLNLNILKSATKYAIDVTLILSPKAIGDNETNFSHTLLLSDRQVKSLYKAFTNKLLVKIKV